MRVTCGEHSRISPRSIRATCWAARLGLALRSCPLSYAAREIQKIPVQLLEREAKRKQAFDFAARQAARQPFTAQSFDL